LPEVKKNSKIKPKKKGIPVKPGKDIPVKPNPYPGVTEQPEINDPRIDDPPPTKPEPPITTKNSFEEIEFRD
jgi:hypothetical protein